MRTRWPIEKPADGLEGFDEGDGGTDTGGADRDESERREVSLSRRRLRAKSSREVATASR
jgi:hypothetical protein